jgi:hypothetical protein
LGTRSGLTLKVIATDAEFEYLNDDDDPWLSELETRAIDLENDISDWRESRQRAHTDRAPRQVPSPGWPRDALRRAAREPEPSYDDEPTPDHQAALRASDPGVRSRADRRRSVERDLPDDEDRAVPRTARRTAGRDLAEDPGPGTPRAARRRADPDPPDDEDMAVARATMRTADRDLAEDPGPGTPRAARRRAGPDAPGDPDRAIPRSARYAVDRDDSYGAAPAAPRPARYAVDLDDDYGAAPTASRPTRRAGERVRAISTPRFADERTQALIARGRRSARSRLVRARNVTTGVGIFVVIAVVLVMIVFRPGASWPPSVSVVQTEIATACQNPNVAAEPNQVNFACGKGTDQVLWVFALLTSGDDPSFTDPKSGRKGLEPITPAQGGEVAWSLDLHHPYDPFNSIDSIEVAARAINNIIGGASLTSTSGRPVVQPGLLSSPANCAKYTGSSAVIARAGFPDICADPVTSQAGEAALVADVYRQWLVGAPSLDAQEASILFQNANDPGNPQVQAILKTLPGASATG